MRRHNPIRGDLEDRCDQPRRVESRKEPRGRDRSRRSFRYPVYESLVFDRWFLMVCGRRVLGRAVEDETMRFTQGGFPLPEILPWKRTSSMWEKRVEWSLEEGGRQRTGNGDSELREKNTTYVKSMLDCLISYFHYAHSLSMPTDTNFFLSFHLPAYLILAIAHSMHGAHMCVYSRDSNDSGFTWGEHITLPL